MLYHIGIHLLTTPSTFDQTDQFDQPDREVLESTLGAALGSEDFSGLTSTSDPDKYTDFIVSAISTAVDRTILKSKSVRTESNPISDESPALIKEKRRLRRQYSQNKDLAVKTCINQLQKQVMEELRVETPASWEKFFNSISLETDPSQSWCKVKNFVKPKGWRGCPSLCHNDKVAKTNADKTQLFAKSVERHFGTESERFDLNHFNEVNKFIEDNHKYFYPPEDPDDYRFDVGNEHELVEDVDPQSLIKLVKFLKRGKAPGPDTIHNEVFRLGTTTSLFHHLAKSTDDHLFSLSQSIMESFNRQEHVVAAILDIEKAFDNVWHNGLRYNIFQLDLPTKMTHWLSDFLVGRVIQVNVNSFLSNQINPKAGIPQGSVLSPLLFYVMIFQHLTTNQTLYPNSLMILHNGLSA